ncbi:MAG: hypothetical protein E6L09_14970 [Verrucomicrobia bacterium]|nr:MAG: hypothetical protein E6L09_14970 [Verrucomicrobiota bacterium]
MRCLPVCARGSGVNAAPLIPRGPSAVPGHANHANRLRSSPRSARGAAFTPLHLTNTTGFRILQRFANFARSSDLTAVAPKPRCGAPRGRKVTLRD